MFSMFLRTLILAIWHVLITVIAGYMATLATKIRRTNTTRERVAVESDDYWNREIVYVERVADDLEEDPVWVTDDLEGEWEVVTDELDEEPVMVN